MLIGSQFHNNNNQSFSDRWSSLHGSNNTKMFSHRSCLKIGHLSLPSPFILLLVCATKMPLGGAFTMIVTKTYSSMILFSVLSHMALNSSVFTKF